MKNNKEIVRYKSFNNYTGFDVEFEVVDGYYVIDHIYQYNASIENRMTRLDASTKESIRINIALMMELKRWNIVPDYVKNLYTNSLKFSEDQIKAIAIIVHLQTIFKNHYIHYKFNEYQKTLDVYTCLQLDIDNQYKTEYGAKINLDFADNIGNEQTTTPALEDTTVPQSIFLKSFKKIAVKEAIDYQEDDPFTLDENDEFYIMDLDSALKWNNIIMRNGHLADYWPGIDNYLKNNFSEEIDIYTKAFKALTGRERNLQEIDSNYVISKSHWDSSNNFNNCVISELKRWSIKPELYSEELKFSEDQMKAIVIIVYLQSIFQRNYVHYEFDKEEKVVKLYTSLDISELEKKHIGKFQLVKKGAIINLNVVDDIKCSMLSETMYETSYNRFAAYEVQKPDLKTSCYFNSSLITERSNTHNESFWPVLDAQVIKELGGVYFIPDDI